MKAQSISEQGLAYSMHIAELIRYLREDGNAFPLCERLLTLGVHAGLYCQNLSIKNSLKLNELAELEKQGKTDRRKKKGQIIAECLREIKYILEMAVCSGYLTKVQTVHIYKEGSDLVEQLVKYK